MMKSDADPFNVVHEEVSASVRALVAEYQKSGDAKRGFSQSELASLQEQLRTLDWDLQDLEDAVNVAKADPVRFSLTASAITERRNAVLRLRSEVDRVRSALKGTAATVSAPDAERDALLGDAALNNGLHGIHAKSHSASDVRSSDWNSSQNEEHEYQLHETMVREQDESLHDLANAVQRIGNIGKEMHDELHDHGVLLDGLETDFDDTSSRMRSIQNRLDDFVSQTTSGQFCTIVVLFFAFIVLTFLVFAT